MNLVNGSILQGGKYRIDSVLGQGGFGITYCGIQTGLNRKVAIKEFFMKEYCERNESTSKVTLGSQGNREQVERFKQKFLKEARLIAGLKNRHIISIHDIFEENGTAYYVMEYIAGGSLTGKVKEWGALPESEAIGYIRQIGEALEYLHRHTVLHLDVKPSNVLIDDDNTAILIDFGISKRYDENGSQTSSTPTGISKGFAPLEQYTQGGMSNFTPSTDIYSLGATLYYLLTATIPPEASVVNDDGLPNLPADISEPTVQAVRWTMQPKRKDRPQSVDEFIDALDKRARVNVSPDENTIVLPKEEKHTVSRSAVIGIAAFIVAAICLTVGIKQCGNFSVPQNNATDETVYADNANAKPQSEAIPDYSGIQIGDFIYSDGTYSHEYKAQKPGSNKYCVGVVFSLETTETERQHGWTHGQAVAMYDDGIFEWEKRSDFDSSKCIDLPAPHTNYIDPARAFSDYEGYAYTHSDVLSERNSVLLEARSMDATVSSGEASPNTSGWYVPAIGQWVKILQNLGKVNIKGRWLQFDKTKAFANLKYIGVGYEENYGDYYWSSTEASKTEAWCIDLINGEITTLDKCIQGKLHLVFAF